MTVKINTQTTSNTIPEVNSSTANKSSINQLPTAMQQSILNYISPKETAASVHLVQRSWQHLLRIDGHLDLSNQDITDADLEQIVKEYKENGKIVSLNLRHCSKITDKALEALTNLPLTQLYLSDCSNITDEGLKALANLPLTQLYLSSCYNITDEGLKALAHLPLTQLKLAGCLNITDKGLEALANLRSLQQLNLAECSNITDKGLKDLANLRSLQLLDLTGCNIKDSDRMSLMIPLSNQI